MKFPKLPLLFVACGFLAGVASGQTYDAYTNFSGAQNPNGVWTYGWSSTLGGSLTVYPNTLVDSSGTNWVDNSIIGDNDPAVANYDLNTPDGYLPPHSMYMAPGPQNQFTNTVWTAPTSGTYNVQAEFTSVDTGGPHAYVLVNGTSVGNALLTENVTQPLWFTVAVAAGDTITAAVGVGTDGVYYNDGVTFSFTVTAVPPPAPPAGTVYDAQADFSSTQNPNGVWTYGWSSTLAGALTVYPNMLNTVGNSFNWVDDSILTDGDPNVACYYSDTADGDKPSDSMTMQAGPQNQFTHCRFTAPVSGTYGIQANFTALDFGAPHAYVLENGTSIGDALLPATIGQSQAYSFPSVYLAAGDTVDAVQGVGSDNTYYNDAMGFSFTVTLVGLPPPTTGTAYDAKTDFSSTQNPNGVWTYGWSSTLGGALTVYPNLLTLSNGYDWVDNSIIADGDPTVSYYDLDTYQGLLPPHSMYMAPGPQNQFTNTVWTAPTSGTYSVQASFTSVDSGAPHAYVLVNGTSIGDTLLPENVAKPFSFPSVVVAAGDTISAAVGVGADGTYYNDGVAFSFTVTAVIPTPPPTLTGTSYDAKSDFSSTENPNGVWTYGWSSTLGGAMTVYPNLLTESNGYDWVDNSIIADGDPTVSYYDLDTYQGLLPPHSMYMAPGPQNQFTNTVWTAPTSGTYSVQASFTSVDSGVPHAYVLVNGTSIGDALLPENVAEPFSFPSVVVAAGDTISAAVGVGADGTYYNDGVAFSFTVTTSNIQPPPPPPPSDAYDAKSDFSSTQNPNGVWTYGWSSTLGGALTVYPNLLTLSNGYDWVDNSIIADGDPTVSYYDLDTYQGLLPPHSMYMAPGPQNQFTDTVWTAPTSGTYSVQATFTSVDTGSPHAYVLVNGTSIGDALLPENVAEPFSFPSVVVAAGDTITATVGVGADGTYYNDGVAFSFTVTPVNIQPSQGPPVAGAFSGLLVDPAVTGSAAEGIFMARVQASGAFTAVLDLGKIQVPLKGKFTTNGSYSTTVTLKGGMRVMVALNFDANGNLSGTVVYGTETLVTNPGEIGNTGPAGGLYTFTLSAAQLSGSMAGVPTGSGFGYMSVRSNGEVILRGDLADGERLSAASWVTSGTSVPIYTNPYGAFLNPLNGVLNFEDIPGASDCAGTLYWNRPAIPRSHSPYAAGFSVPAKFTASQFQPAIGGLQNDAITFVAADTTPGTTISTAVTLHAAAGGTYTGQVPGVHITLVPLEDSFSGTLRDPQTHAVHPFAGILLPKSRTGSGFFMDEGLGGSVDIKY